MALSRPLCAAVAAATLISALWFPTAQVDSAETTSTAAMAPAFLLGNTGGQEAAELPPFKPVARISSLMTGIGSAFGKIREVLPVTDDEHRLRKITSNAEVIAELSNVHTRHRRKPSYIEMAANTRSLAQELAREARADTPDEAKLATLFGQLDVSCSTCHDADK